MRFLAHVEPRERTALVLSFCCFFFVLASYYVVRPVRDQLGATAGGSASLPFFYTVVFVVMLALTPLYGFLVARFPRRRFLPVVYAFFIVCMLAFSPWFERGGNPKLLATSFFVWVSVFNLFVVSVFWSFMADIYSQVQAKRLFSTIALGGTAGAIAGPRITAFLVEQIGVGKLLWVSAGLLALALAAILGLVAWSRRHPVEKQEGEGERPIGGGILAGARLIWQSPFLFRMAILMLLADCIGTVLYALMLDIARANYATPEARTAFFANVDFATNLLQILCQVSLTRWLLRRHGPRPALVGSALVNVVVLAALAVTAHPLVVAVAIVITRAGAYGVVQPARESLFTRVDREARYKAKNFIDTVVWRGGDIGVTVGLNALKQAGMAIPGFALLCAAAAAGSAWLGALLPASPELAPEKNEDAARSA